MVARPLCRAAVEQQVEGGEEDEDEEQEEQDPCVPALPWGQARHRSAGPTLVTSYMWTTRTEKEQSRDWSPREERSGCGWGTAQAGGEGICQDVTLPAWPRKHPRSQRGETSTTQTRERGGGDRERARACSGIRDSPTLCLSIHHLDLPTRLRSPWP